MFTEVNQPERIRRKELDDYLAKGWFRMGQSIFTCQFLFFKSQVYSSIWVRLVLQNYTFRKSLRKLKAKNGNRFRTIVQKAVFDQSKDDLYQLHKKRFEGYVANSLKESLMEGKDTNIYETYEVNVYDGDLLIAVSFFDLGKESIASIMGLFHPEYEKYSLGFYTMLMEIDFCMQQKMKYYYPGYVVPGYPSFDYKLRIGDVEYYCPYDQVWKNWERFNLDTLPSKILLENLVIAEKELSASNISSKLVLYPMYDKKVFGYKPEEFVRSPLVLILFPEESGLNDLIIEYDIFKQIYKLKIAIRFEEGSGYVYTLYDKYDLDKTCFDLLFIANILSETKNLSDIVALIQASRNKPLA